MEDIEDLFNEGDSLLIEPSRVRDIIVPKVRKRHNAQSKILNNEQSLSDVSDIEVETILPEMKKIYIKTWGCAHNNSDSEYMAGQLASLGYNIVDDKKEADLWLLNSCTVKNPAEDHLRNEIDMARAEEKKVVIAGCVSQGAPKSEYLKGLSLIGVQQIDRVAEVVEETYKGNSVRILGPKRIGRKKQGGASLTLPKIRRNPLIEIISISTGCLNQCTYCKTKHARGELGSYPIEEIVERARQSFKEGVCEIWLTSEDTGAYGRDIDSTLPELLEAIVKVIPQGCRLRLGMTNPPYILDHLQEMAEILRHPRVYSFLHVPVQSGSDFVLAEMKREYTRADFEKVVDTLKEKLPGITIATDIICGFPTETFDDFEETLSLCRKYKFPSLFINQFYPRPGTPAARMIRLPTQEVKKRSRMISELFKSYHPYDHKMGEIHEILLTEESHDQLHLVGHNKFYEQVLVPKEIAGASLGKLINVEIIETGKHFMKGKPANGYVYSPNPQEAFPKGSISGLGPLKQDLVNSGSVPLKQDLVNSGSAPLKQDRVKQEKVIIFSFVLCIFALVIKLAMVFYILFGLKVKN